MWKQHAQDSQLVKVAISQSSKAGLPSVHMCKTITACMAACYIMGTSRHELADIGTSWQNYAGHPTSESQHRRRLIMTHSRELGQSGLACLRSAPSLADSSCHCSPSHPR